MGQYFLLASISKREFVDPHKIGYGLKLWEWCANRQCGVIPFLMAMGDDDGGALRGRWAGDKVVLIGDYDESKLYNEVRETYTEISEWLIEAYNDFIGIEDRFIGSKEDILKYKTMKRLKGN